MVKKNAVDRIIPGKHETEMARKMKSDAEQKYVMMKDRQRVTEDDLAKTKVRLEKAQREVSSLDQRLGRALEENTLLRKKAGTQVWLLLTNKRYATKIFMCIYDQICLIYFILSPIGSCSSQR